MFSTSALERETTYNGLLSLNPAPALPRHVTPERNTLEPVSSGNVFLKGLNLLWSLLVAFNEELGAPSFTSIIFYLFLLSIIYSSSGVGWFRKGDMFSCVCACVWMQEVLVRK